MFVKGKEGKGVREGEADTLERCFMGKQALFRLQFQPQCHPHK